MAVVLDRHSQGVGSSLGERSEARKRLPSYKCTQKGYAAKLTFLPN